jgi:hypothetical protein
MGSADKIHVMLLQEAGYYVGTESERDTAIVFAPACYVLIWVGPKQIAKETAVGDLCQSAN